MITNIRISITSVNSGLWSNLTRKFGDLSRITFVLMFPNNASSVALNHPCKHSQGVGSDVLLKNDITPRASL